MCKGVRRIVGRMKRDRDVRDERKERMGIEKVKNEIQNIQLL